MADKIVISKKSSKNMPTYSPILSDYLKETLRVSNIRNKKKEGGKITVTDDREIRNNDDKKVRVLNNHIFRSLANLIYFFEFLGKHSELIDKYAEDIEELFGLKSSKDPQSNAFARFIQAILGQHSESQISSSQFNYERHLLYIMQSCILRKAFGYFMLGGRDVHLRKSFTEDLQKAEGWMRFLAEPTDNQNKRIKRKLVLD